MAEKRGGKRPGAGRPKGTVSQAKQEIAATARGYATEMLKVLVNIAKDKEQPASARVSAASHVIERGYGKPVAPVEHDATDRFSSAFKQLLSGGSRAPIKRGGAE